MSEPAFGIGQSGLREPPLHPLAMLSASASNPVGALLVRRGRKFLKLLPLFSSSVEMDQVVIRTKWNAIARDQRFLWV